ncbi:TetR family transcriptional regulator C-terminal domain-containing protein [Rapidithrix thailandica]|uniref:TetR family transcriptional regulator C-terminal domain-containing protein n=1 Tax=Rapidithrix thailandica TaxID=413964 RepID=A0AAW9S0E1_9BACT
MENFKKNIQEKYIEYLSEYQRKPNSVYSFVKGIGIEEKQFYEYYNSFEDIDNSIWKKLIESTLEAIQKEEVWQQYSVREKMLSYCYTLIEQLKIHRTYYKVVAEYTSPSLFYKRPAPLEAMKEAFSSFASDMVLEGMDSGEMVNRPYFSDKYTDGLWLLNVFVIKFWLSDSSTGFEKSDAAIEKSVNLYFDVLAKTPLDSAFDFAKFMFQNRC